MSLLPASATRDARLLLATRGIRAFVDGTVYVILPAFLLQLGFSGVRIGFIIASSLLGSGALTLAAGCGHTALHPCDSCLSQRLS